MKKLMTIALLTSFFTVIVLFQNCSKVSVKELDAADTKSFTNGIDDVSVPTGNPAIDNLVKSCADAKQRGKMSVQKINVQFDDPGSTCKWGQNGNSSERNTLIRARIEQYKSISLPSGATVCDIQMSNVNLQEFIYDDNIIITVNNYIIASTSNFTRHLTSNSGYYLYDWSKLLDKDAQNDAVDTTADKQYCAGGENAQSVCTFPVTETVGAIHLDFDKQVIQSILGLSNASAVNLGFVTTGDNDSTDCRHTPVHFDVQVDYY